MKVKILALVWALQGICLAQSPSLENALQGILREAKDRQLVLVVADPPRGTTSIPEADQVSPEEDDPGTAIPS